MTVNKAILIGRLGADPEVDETPSGTTVCELRVATSHHYDGEEVTSWHDVTCWGGLAESCGRYLEIGRRVYVEGRIEYDEWEDSDGNRRSSTSVVADTVQFLGGESGGSSGSSGGRVNSGEGEEYEDDSFSDSDIPFAHRAALEYEWECMK